MARRRQKESRMPLGGGKGFKEWRNNKVTLRFLRK